MASLNAKQVENAKPRTAAYKLGDGKGLYLLVKPTGAKSWLLRVQVGGTRRDIGLGALETESLARLSHVGNDIPLEKRSRLTLAQARELAIRLRNVAKAGGDPAAERRRDRSPPPSFRAAAVAAHKALAGGWSARTADAFLSSLGDHAFPSLGDKRVDEIDADDIAIALVPIWNSKPSMARKVRQRIGKVLDYAKAKRWRVNETPRQSVSTLVGKSPAGGNFNAMPYAEVPAFYRALCSETETVGRLALLFVIATGARSGEVREVRWKHLDLAKGNWNRPAELQRKTGKAHTITLSPQAIEVLTRARAFSEADKPDALVFPNRKGAALSDMTLSKILRDKGLIYVPHGFRSALRDYAAEVMPQIPDPVAESALGHVVPDAVQRAYKRAQFLQMRRELLDAWGGYLAGEENNVVRLDKVRA